MLFCGPSGQFFDNVNGIEDKQQCANQIKKEPIKKKKTSLHKNNSH